MEGKCEIETSAAGTSRRDGFAIGNPVRGLITSTNGAGSGTGWVDVVSVAVTAGVDVVDEVAGEAIPVGRPGLQLWSAKDIKMI